MSTRFYQATHLNIERIAQDLEGFFLAKGYQTQHITNETETVVQLREGSNFEALLGMQATLGVILRPTPNGVMATVGEQQWIDKAAVGFLGAVILWPLLVTAGVGFIRQANLEYQLLNALDMVVLRQNADVHITADPSFSSPMPPQQGSQPPYPHPHPPNVPPQSGPIPMPGYGQKPCPKCQSIIDADDAFCSHCGMSLLAQKKVCTNCKAELKADAVFCVKCGTPVAS
jgi:RNA polymerase subunit RPABC4/transcription elongation factor Spt4